LSGQVNQARLGQILAEGLAHHNAGRLPQAEAAYRQVLEADADHVDALHYMGVLALQVGKAHVAVQLMARAHQLQPKNPLILSNLGAALRREGRNAEALVAYRQALALDPRMADTLNNIANVLIEQGTFDEAEEVLERLARERPAQAVSQYLSLSKALLENELYGRAVPVLERCLRLDPASADACSNLGVALRKLKRNDEALAVYRRGLLADPANASLFNNIGISLQEAMRRGEAIVAFRRAVRLRPDYKEAELGLVNALRLENRIDEANLLARQAVARHPDFADLRFSLGFGLLMRGEYREGFAEYEWRSRMANFEPKRDFPTPRWNGEPLNGRKLLVHDEQGVGDALQFLRFIDLLPKDADWVMECNGQLVRLFQGVPGIPEVVLRTAPAHPHDLHVPLLSLPAMFGITLDDLPGRIPYLHAEPDLAEAWRKRLDGPGLKVGLVWAGSTGFGDDHLRSPRLEPFLRLLDIPGVRFFALQKGDGCADLEGRAMPANFTDLGPEIGNFADTAAICVNLDLVISSCTSPVHLAGGLGVPTWVVLPFAPDWRWMLGRDDSPWYPSVRLFRQDRPGRDWAPVMGRVAAALDALRRGGGHGSPRPGHD
jgi:tetratricopeptide (TPR) repeat protein